MDPFWHQRQKMMVMLSSGLGGAGWGLCAEFKGKKLTGRERGRWSDMQTGAVML